MSGKRAIRIAATSARVLTGAVVAVACVVGMVIAVSAPWPVISTEPARTEVTPQPGDTVLVCNGDFRALGRDTANPLRMEPAASALFTMDSTTGSAEISQLAVTDLDGAGEVRRLSGAVVDGAASLIGAAESTSLDTEDLAGFAAAPCRSASSESWLIGGTVQTGSADLIVLSNPGTVPSTVALTVYGTVRTTSTTIVPALSQLALPLSAIASGTDVPVVKVSAEGAQVRAVLQSSLTQTLDPIGIDLQDAIAAPQQHPVIAGVELFPDESDDASAAVVRLLAPGADTTARITVRAVGDSSVAHSVDVPLTADVPAQVGLSNLDSGVYNVYVDADDAVLAGVRIQDGVAPGSDFAWLMPAPDIADEVLVAVPSGPTATLFLVNDGGTDATVVLSTTSGGDERTITVPAGSSASAVVDPKTVYSMNPTGPVHAAIAMTGTGAIAGWPVWSGAGAQQNITVYP
ncbi:MAG: DUF5719 family protein [Microbacterium sp.]